MPWRSKSSSNRVLLWDIPDEFEKCTEDLLKKNLSSLTPEDLQDHFEKKGFGDLLPHWFDIDYRTVAIDGKISMYEKWKERLSSESIGLDALMNISALYSFATDQKALDERIRGLI